jgi:hypothetical protein
MKVLEEKLAEMADTNEKSLYLTDVKVVGDKLGVTKRS